MNNSEVGPKWTVVAGPCVIEDEGLVTEVAQELKRQLAGLPVEFYFKSSFDKANRTSIESFRGPGIVEGKNILGRVKAKTGLSILTDFHEPSQAEFLSDVVDFLQIPAFLCRQTDMIVAGCEAALKRGKKLNVKKGQFLAPWDTRNIIEKARSVERESASKPDSDWFWLTERGVSFGYNTLVVDMISFQCIQSLGSRVIYDATHSIQVPGGAPGGKSTGGKREYLESLARAAVAAGADGIFLECHPDPSRAKSDGPNAFHLQHVGVFLEQCLAIRNLVKSMPKLLPEAQSNRT